MTVPDGIYNNFDNLNTSVSANFESYSKTSLYRGPCLFIVKLRKQ